MKKSRACVWMGIIVFFAVYVSMCASAVGFSVAVGDIETDLGIILSAPPSDCQPCEKRDGVVLDPDKLAVLGLTGIGKGDSVQVIHQVTNLWHIVDKSSGAGIRIRVKSMKSYSGDSWPFPSAF